MGLISSTNCAHSVVTTYEPSQLMFLALRIKLVSEGHATLVVMIPLQVDSLAVDDRGNFVGWPLVKILPHNRLTLLSPLNNRIVF